MRKFEFNKGDIYLGDHSLCDDIRDRSQAKEFLEERLDLIFKDNKSLRDYIEIFGIAEKLKNYAVIFAHGETNHRDEWCYSDKGNSFPVQSWIKRMDGKYAGLILDVCNPKSQTPISRKSILVVPDENIDNRPFSPRNPIFSLIVPGVGEIDSYSIDYELAQLRKRLPQS